MARRKGQRKSSWIVQMRCTVIRVIVCEDCTEEQARDDPFGHSTDEGDDLELVDWEVNAVDENV